MFNGEEDFKFYVYEHQVFDLEKLLIDNKIKFHNELGISTNIRTNKYYIKNSDRKKLDNISKRTNIDIFTDNHPTIETRFPEIKFNFINFFAISLIIILLLYILIS